MTSLTGNNTLEISRRVSDSSFGNRNKVECLPQECSNSWLSLGQGYRNREVFNGNGLAVSENQSFRVNKLSGSEESLKPSLLGYKLSSSFRECSHGLDVSNSNAWIDVFKGFIEKRGI